jgi:hypothetical protein
MDSKMYSLLDNVYTETGDLIIKQKALDFNGSRKTLSSSETNILYNSLNLVDKGSSAESKRLLSLSVLLYFQAEYDESKLKKFHSTIDFLSVNTKTRNSINIESLYILFNVVEFEYKFRQLDNDKLRLLSTTLSAHEKLDKSLVDQLLFKYYVAVLNYLLNNRGLAASIVLDLICDFSETSGENNYFIEYLSLRNSILNVKNLETETDCKESLAHLESLYDTYKTKYRYNDEFNIKVGFKICDLLFAEYNFKKIYDILIGVLDVIRKNVLISEKKINNYVEIYCNIVSRLEASCVYLGKYDEMLRFIKKLDKTVILSKEKNSESVRPVLPKFFYYLNIYKTIYKFKSVETDEFISSIADYKRIINNNIDQESTINIYSLFPKDSVNNNFYESLYQYENIIKSGNFPKVNFLNLFFSVFNHLTILMKEITNENDKRKQFELLTTMNNYSKNLIDYINKFIYQDKYGLFVNYEYLRDMLIKLHYFYIYSSYYTGDYNKAIENIISFNSLSNKLHLSSGNTVKSLSLISKLKGDIHFKKQEYKIAMDIYKETLRMYDEVNIQSNLRPLVLYNMALCSIILKDNSAKEYLSQSLSLFEKLNIKFQNVFTDKIEEIRNRLKQLS